MRRRPKTRKKVGMRARAQAKSWQAPAMAANEAITR